MPPALVLLLSLVLVACTGSRSPPARVTAPGQAAAELLVTLPSAGDASPLVQLAASERHLFWTTAAGIMEADLRGRSPRLLVADVYVSWMRAAGDQLDYRAEGGDGERLYRVAAAGGPPRPLPPGEVVPPAYDDGDVRLSDDRGEVLRTLNGYALVVTPPPGTGALPSVVLPGGRGHLWLPSEPALVGDALIAGELTPDDAVRVWRLPRAPADAATIVRTAEGDVEHLTAAGGQAYVVEVPRTDDPTARPDHRLLRVDATGRARELATAPAIDAIAARGDAVAYAVPGDDGGGGALWLVEGEQAPRVVVERRGSELAGLALADRAVFWVEDGALWTAPRTGGAPQRFHQPAWGDAGGTSRADLVVDGASVYFSGVGLGATGVFRTRGGTDATELWPPPDDGMGDELLQIGGDLFARVGPRALWRIPMDGTAPRAIFEAPEDVELTAATAGGGWLYVVASASDGRVIHALDPRTGAVVASHHVVVDLDGIAADDEALYVSYFQPGWLVRIPHPPR